MLKIASLFVFSCLPCLLAGQHFQTFSSNPAVPPELSGSLVSSTCDSTFVRRIGNANTSEQAFFLLPTPDGNFIIGGQDDDRSLLLLVDGSGEILWQRAFDFTAGDDFIRFLMLDSDGYLVGSVRDQLDAGTLHHIFKYDYQNDNFLWVRNLSSPAHTRMEGMLEKPANGNYLFYGMTNPGTYDNYILEVDKNNGAPQWQRQFDFGGNTDIFQAHAIKGQNIYFANAERLGGGLDDIRSAISKMDFSGNLNWTRTYFVPSSQSARMYNEDILIENDTIVCVSRGNLTSDDLTNATLQLFKTDLAGNLLFGKNYAINGGNSIWARHIHAVPGGYILQGNYFRNGVYDAFFIRVDKNGNVIWANRMGTDGEDFCWSSAVVGDFICFAARSWVSSGGNFDILFGKLSLNGNAPTGNCELFEPIQVTFSNIFNSYDGLEVPSVQSPAYAWNTAAAALLPANLMVSDIAGCECEEPTQDSCNLQLDFTTQLACPYAFDGEITANVSSGTPPFSYNWETGTSITDQLTGIDVGTYSVTVTDAQGCVVADSVTLGAVTKPVVLGEVTDLTCYRSIDGVLTITDADPSLQFSLFGEISQQTKYDSLSAGSYSLNVLDTFGCVWVQFFTVSQPPPISLQLPGDVTIELGETFEINSTIQQNPLDFAWTPDTWLSCATCPNPVAQPEVTTTYLLTVTDSNGCFTTDSIQITVEFTPGIYVPNVFSPNADGINDTFYVFGDGIDEVRELRIFDRWGELVFEKTNFPPNDPLYGWDGTFRGKPMNSDVFAFYFVVGLLDGSERMVEGDLTLLR